MRDLGIKQSDQIGMVLLSEKVAMEQRKTSISGRLIQKTAGQ